MHQNVQDLKLFYNSREGRIVRRIIKKRLLSIWPHIKNANLAGFGYSAPYLWTFKQTTSKPVLAVMNAQSGAHSWPYKTDDRNAAVLTDPAHIPIGRNMLDHALVIHHLEYIKTPDAFLSQLFQALKPRGRALICVPSRHGLWAHAEWSPFGSGLPFSQNQIIDSLKKNDFTIEQSQDALFMPPLKSKFWLRGADLIETLGKIGLPLPSGMHIIEVSKQIYARPSKGTPILSSTPIKAGLIPSANACTSGQKPLSK